MVDETIVGKVVQIRRKPRRDSIIAPCTDDVRPDILKKLFRGCGVATLPQEIAIERTFVSTVELVECADIAFAIGEHQLLVARSVVPGHHGLAVCPRSAGT
jgi:hypothetical protein